MTYEGAKYRIAKYVWAFPNTHAVLDPVGKVGESIEVLLADFHKIKVTE